jgi:acetolactate decarboxylase
VTGHAPDAPLADGSDDGAGVRWAGAQRDVLAGDLRGHVSLETLSRVPHLYGLGPLEGVRGEVSIFDGVPSIARIDRHTVVTAASWNVRACFLVWAQVPAWSERDAEHGNLAGLDGLEREVVVLAREAGLDPDRPFPFRVRATAVEATLHVLDKRDGLAHTPERHEQSKVRHTLEDTGVELIGFHSQRHRGIFTPGEANIHVHLQTEDGRISGHLEAIRLAPVARVAVPAAGWRQ